MVLPIVLASGSAIRARLLDQANIPHEVAPVKVDEESIRASLQAQSALPRDIADALADAKARRGSSKRPDALVVGCDQILDFGGQILSKPHSPEDVREQLDMLSGQKHTLFSAVVIYLGGTPQWRYVAKATLHMRPVSANYLDDYVSRNWDSIQHSVGGYKLEEEGARLFHRIDGDYFCVLGLPLFELLAYLMERKAIPG